MSIDESAMGIGGGITSFGVLTLTNSTLSSNMATEQGGGVSGGTLTMVSTTISGNVAPVGAAISGISGLGGASSTARNSIIDGECALGQAIESLGGNVESPSDTCFVAQTTDQVSVPASSLQLDALADNGGPTETHALGWGSVAIDAIPAENCVDADGLPVTEDQRGEPRPAGDGCDVGAFELQP